MNEQIEHIAKVIHDSDIADINTFPISMSECLARHGARRTGEAMALFKAGYRKQSEWISVEDRLPKKEGLYLVYTKKGYIEIDRFAIFDVGYYWVELEDYVTHWMPLPEAPEMKGGAE